MIRRRFVIGVLIGVPIGILIYKLIQRNQLMDGISRRTVTPSTATKPAGKSEKSIVLSEISETSERAPDEVSDTVAPDDLKRISGIGPKISGLLNKAGIFTFQQLADAKLETVEAILEEAGPRFQLADPDDWAKQALELVK